MTEWIDVPVAEVREGDEVKVDGMGHKAGTVEWVEDDGSTWVMLSLLQGSRCMVAYAYGLRAYFRRSSIVTARRRKPEPIPKPGDWRCADYARLDILHSNDCPDEWYRASSGWSRDTRTGEPWVMKCGDPVEVVIKARAGDIRSALDNATRPGLDMSGRPIPDYYKRIGLDVRPVDRRGKR